MPAEKIKRAYAMNRVAPVKILDRSSVLDSQLGVEPLNFSVFISNPLIHPHAVVVTALDHTILR